MPEPHPTIRMQRFPHPGWTDNRLLSTLEFFLAIVLWLSFITIPMCIVHEVNVEKETQVKEVMKIMGLPSWLHWASWFLKYLVLMILSLMITTFVLTFSFCLKTDCALLNYSDPTVVFVFLLLFICATITWSFMVSAFFKKAEAASAVALVLYCVTCLPIISFSTTMHENDYLTKILASLLSNTAMGLGFKLIVKNELASVGAQWSNVWKSPSPEDGISLGVMMLMLMIDAVLYMLIALYVEAILPGEYGVPQPWYFLCSPTFWCGQTVNAGKCETFNLPVLKLFCFRC